MHKTQQLILDTLAKLGPSKPFVIADKTGIEAANVGYHLRQLLNDGQVKASGTSNDRLYALPGQKLEGESAPPQRRKAKNGAARARPAAPAAGFLPAFTADQRLVVIEGERAARIFSTDETQKLADLLLQHFDA